MAYILLVDDEMVSLRIMKNHLLKLGHQVHATTSATKAWKFFMKNQAEIDLLLTDIFMEELSGIVLVALCHEMKDDLHTIVFSAIDELDLAIQAMEAGACNYLIKPVSRRALEVSLQKCISRQRMERELAVRKEIELRRDIREHSGRMSGLGEMASAMAHEMGQPLSVISITVQTWEMLLKKGRLEPETILKDIDQIKSNIRRMARQLDHIRKLSHPAGILDNLPINQVVEDAFSLSRAQLKNHGISLLEKMPEDSPLVKADASELEQVFINLFTNARYSLEAKKNKDSDFNPVLKVEVISDNDIVKVIIDDNGEGVPEHLRAKIFVPFFTTKPQDKGSGLGLHLCRQILEKFKGKLKLLDKEEDGAGFQVSLPCHFPEAGGQKTE